MLELNREDLIHIYQGLELKKSVLRTTIDTHTSSVDQAKVTTKMVEIQHLILRVQAELDIFRKTSQLFPEEES